MSSTFTLFNSFRGYLGAKKIDLTSDSFKAVLSNTAPDKAANKLLADITQIATGADYTGPIAMTGVTYQETVAGNGIWQFTVADFTITATNANLPTFRYVAIYDDSVATPLKPLVGYLDYGAAVNITQGNGFTVDVQANGLFQDTSTP